MNHRWVFLAAVLVLGLATVSFAQDEKSKVDGLLEHIKRLEERIAELENSPAAIPVSELERSINALATGDLGSETDFNVRWKNTLRHDTADGAFQIKIGGRIMNDWVFGFQDNDYENLVVADPADPALGRFEDGTEFRRVRLFVAGTIYTNAFFKLQLDFTDGDADFKDVYLGLKNLGFLGSVTVGQFFQPMGLEQLTSSKYITFMERAAPVQAFTPDRQTGLKFQNTALDGDRMTWAVSVYREVDTYGDTTTPNDGQLSLAARITGLPWWEEDGRRMVHLGFGINYRNPDQQPGARSRVRFRARPEIHLAPRVVNTDHIAADSALVLNAEVAVVLGAFSFQGEFYYASVDANGAGVNDPSFWGFYAYVSYFLTGEHRHYKKKLGAFGRVKPRANFMDGEGGSGAWEIAARFSMVDLNDEAVNGGEMWNLTLALTWYLNPNTQVKLNYIYTNLDNGAGGSQEGEAHIVGIRFQIDF